VSSPGSSVSSRSSASERYTHGHVFDFYKQLKRDPTKLRVLGDGKQRKSYLYIQDCVDAMLMAMDKTADKVNVFNLGVDGYCVVTDSHRLDLRGAGREAHGWSSPAAIAGGLATTPSSSLKPLGSVRWGGSRISVSGKDYQDGPVSSSQRVGVLEARK